MAMTRVRTDELVNLWVGDQDTPFQIALLGVFDAGPFLSPDDTVDVPSIRSALAARVRRVPPLGRRVVWTQLGEGRPLWIEDPSFDPTAHVEVATLPPGADLANWAANRVVRPLDLNRPLWRAEVVNGLPDRRFALIIVVHHMVADGMAGVAMIGSLLDSSTDAVVAPPPAIAVPPLPSKRQLVRERVHEAGAALRRAHSPTAGSLGRLRRGVSRFQDVMADLRARAPVTSLPRQVGPERRLAIVRQPLEDVQRTGHALGVTVNDLLLAAVTGGLREMLTARGEHVAGLVLRTSVPAATGGPGQVGGMLVAELPVGEPDPLRRLALIHRTTATRKARLHAGGGDVSNLLQLAVPVARPAVRSLRRFGGTRINLYVTDVPGPTAPLWLAGARLLEAVPIAPLVPHVPMGVAALSYAGQLAISVNVDAAVTDLDVLAGGVERSFSDVRALTQAGSRLPRIPATVVARGAVVVDCAAHIDRAPEDVFAYCTDPRHEPEWNRQLVAVETLTDGPVGQGSRYRLRFRSGVGDSIVTYVGFEPPRSWTSTSTSARLAVRFEGEVVPDARGSYLRFRAQLLPRGALRLLAPVLRRLLRRRWEQDLAVIRSVLENSALDNEGDGDRGDRSRVREPVRQHP